MACLTVGHMPLSLRLDPLPRQETRGLVLLPEIGGAVEMFHACREGARLKTRPTAGFPRVQ